jgi:hypothetical protein
MNGVEVLVYDGKHGDQLWLVDTPARKVGAMKALFQQLDEDGCYEGDVIEDMLTAARDGCFAAIKTILQDRNGCEYECWRIETAEIVE